MKLHPLAICFVCAALSLPTAARAQSTASASETTSAALSMKLDLGRSKLDAEAVRLAVERELRRPVTIAGAADDASLSVVANADRTVTVSYRTSRGETRTRSVGLPEDSSRGAEIVALLSGNLSRDEAAELLAELTAKAAPSAPAAAATSTGEGLNAAPTAKDESPPTTTWKPTAGETRSPRAKGATPTSRPPLLSTPFPSCNLSLFAPVSLYSQSERRIFKAELGLFYSHVGELHGGGLNLFVLHTERDLRGVSFATFYNRTGGSVSGASGSALLNRRYQLRGFEFAGLLNLGSGDGRGASAAGLANLSGDFIGLQAAGLSNWANAFRGVQATGLGNRSQHAVGLQVAGLMNWSGRFQGAQVAGGANVGSRFEGLQAAGGVNVAETISGLQVGVVNVAQEVRGVQLGVVNVAKRVHGTSIGLVSVAGNGRVQPVFWLSSAELLNVAAKFSVGPLYTQAGLGFALENQTYTYELGLGGHIPIHRFFIEPGVHYSEMRSSKHPFDHELIEYGHYRVAVGLDLGQVSPFAGGGVLQRFAHSVDAPASSPVSAEVFGGAAFF